MEPITWAEAREELAGLHESLELAHRMATLAVLSPHESVRGDRVHIDAFADLHERVEHLVGVAERLLEMLAESSEPERPDRLAVALAGIVALGHENVSVIRRASPLRWYVQSDNASERWPGSDSGPERIRAYYAAVEQGEAEAPGGDMEAAATAAEARLAQIRELREQQRAAVVALVETLSYRPETVHFAPVFGQDMVCGRSTRWPGVVHTEDPSAVTCPACREWMDTNAVLSEADIEAFLTAIGAGPEEVDSEHEARMEWVVEPLAPLLDGAVSEAELMYGPGAYNQHEPSVYDDATHILAGHGLIRIPWLRFTEDDQSGRYAVGELCRAGDSHPWKVVERKPGEAPSVVFDFSDREEAESCRDALNTGAFTPLMDMDPEVQPITGPTDAEEDDRATAEHCPQRPGGHEFDSYHVCVHCEYETDAEAAELAALARADHERERMASEGEEA